MNLILDTHTFMWFVNGEENLTVNARKVITNPDNSNFISVATLWEIAIKVSIGKLTLSKDFENISRQITQNGFNILAITFEHVLLVSKLAFHHNDPFDRLIIAQALTGGMSVVGKDEAFDKYNVKRIW